MILFLEEWYSQTILVEVEYSRVCGQFIGYQVSTPDAFSHVTLAGGTHTIDNAYVDGISLTHGS